MTEQGILYVATGESYRAEAAYSALSARAVMPGLPITLISDSPGDSAAFDETLLLADPRFDFQDKIRGIGMSPFHRTIFLDSDTYIAADISDLFILLDRFDLAAAHSVGRENVPIPGIPYAFSELNTGVLAFKKSVEWESLVSKWLARYLADRDRMDHREGRELAGDQVAFRELVYYSDLRLAILPPEYNCRYDAGFLFGEARVIHQRSDGPEIAKSAAMLNSVSGKRVHLADHPDAIIRRWTVIDHGIGENSVLLRALLREEEGNHSSR
jgi:hypothetical protein